MKKNMFCISKKLLMIVGIFSLVIFTFFALNTFNKNKITKNSEASSFLCRGKLELINGKLFYPKETCCNGTTKDNICFESFIGGKHYSLNCQTKEFTKSNCSNEQVGDVIKKTPTPTFIPKKIPTKTPTPTKKPLKLSPTVISKPTDYVASVSLNKIDNVNYDLFINQKNFGSDANSTTRIIIIPLTAGDTSSSYSVNNKCMTNGGRIEKLTLAKAEIVITTSRNNFNISVTGKNLDGVENFIFLNTDISYNVPGKSIGAVITETILDRGDGNRISIKGCFNKT